MYPEELRSTRRLACHARFLGATRTAIRGEIADVSTSGACLVVSADAGLTRGQQLHLEFSLLTGEVEVVSEVRWVTSRGGQVEVGLRFVRIAADALAAIAALSQPRRPLTSAGLRAAR
jgi:hypothetical protein